MAITSVRLWRCETFFTFTCLPSQVQGAVAKDRGAKKESDNSTNNAFFSNILLSGPSAVGGSGGGLMF